MRGSVARHARQRRPPETALNCIGSVYDANALDGFVNVLLQESVNESAERDIIEEQ